MRIKNALTPSRQKARLPTADGKLYFIVSQEFRIAPTDSKEVSATKSRIKTRVYGNRILPGRKRMSKERMTGAIR
jgi:hypothetical protein